MAKKQTKKKPRKPRGLKNLPPGALSSRNAAMVAMFPWKLCMVKDLPKAHLESLRAHMEPSPQTLQQTVNKAGKKTRIGIVKIPIEVLLTQVMNDPGRVRDFSTFDEYHWFYASEEKVPKHSPRGRWPIVLSGPDWARETIIDGWHRFHSYYRCGVKSICAIWYVDE